MIIIKGIVVRTLAMLPGLMLLMMVDSVSKEPYGLPLYSAAWLGGMLHTSLLMGLISVIRGRTQRRLSTALGAGVALVSGFLAGGVGIIYLIVTGH